jgi:hypothetical protein
VQDTEDAVIGQQDLQINAAVRARNHFRAIYYLTTRSADLCALIAHPTFRAAQFLRRMLRTCGFW